MQEKNKLFYSISEVSEKYGIASSTLRFWEKEFTELNPVRNKKGNRFYTSEDVAILDMIYFLVKEKGYTLKGAHERMRTDLKGVEKNVNLLKTLKEVKSFLIELKKELNNKSL